MKYLVCISLLVCLSACGSVPQRQAVTITDSSWVRLGATPMKFGVREKGVWKEYTHANKKEMLQFFTDHKGYLLIHPRYMK